MRKTIFLILLFLCGRLQLPSQSWTVTGYGAVPGKPEPQTEVLQRVIDLCSADGGGTVHIPPGTFVSGALFLKDNVMLCLEQGAVLKGSADLRDWPGLEKHRLGVVNAMDVRNAGICGTGTVDANGNEPVFQQGPKSPLRLYAVNLERCTRIRVSDVSLVNASYWTLRIDDCENVRVSGIDIHSTSYFNNDGIDIDGRNIIVSDCIIDCIDDAICLKSYYRDRPCENVVITGCTVSSNCNAIKLGTASEGGFRNITVSDCTVRRPSRNDYFDYRKYIVPGITDNYVNNSGIALEMVDGGIMEHVTIDNVTMDNVLTPIFIRLGERRNPPAGIMRNIVISNITAASCSLMSCSVTGIPGHPVENVMFSDIILTCPGGGRTEHLFRNIPEAEHSYPENKIFGADLPAYGFYLRHVRNLTFDNVQFNLESPDDRKDIYLEDCENVRMTGVRTSDVRGKAIRRESCDSQAVAAAKCPAARENGRFALSLVKWSFRTRTENLCDLAADAGIPAIEMADPEKWDTILGKGLRVALADGVDMGVERGFCDRRWHSMLYDRYSRYLPVLAEKGIRQVVCYSGIDTEHSPEEAMETCVEGLEPVVALAESLGITVIMELVSSRPSEGIFARHSFEHYRCDNPEWGAELCRRLDSENFGLLYDVWQMNDMGRDVFDDMRRYRRYIRHYHVSGIPDRGIPAPDDPFDYSRFVRILDETGYSGFVGIEPDRVEKDLRGAISRCTEVFGPDRDI